MTGKIQFLFISSFLMGMFAGGYFYVSYFAPLVESTGTNVAADQDEDFIIEGVMYGGCARLNACASFQLVDGRTFHYTVSTEQDVQTGTLPRSFAESIQNSLTDDTLHSSRQSITSTSCSSYVDGIDYHYTVFKDGDRYELDTCNTTLAYDQALQDVFLDIWYAMENSDDLPEEPFELDLGELLRDRFHNPPSN